MEWLKAFVSGFVSTLIFHQGLFAVLHLAGMIPVAPYNFTPVPPFGVPAVGSLSFFGGLWGILLWALVRRRIGWSHWGLSILFGAIAPTLVAMLVVFPLKGAEPTAQMWIGGLLLNGMWGLGVAICMALAGAQRSSVTKA